MSLEADLRRHVAGEIRFTQGDRALYASDSSNYRHVPLGVVVPRSVEDIARAVAVCAEYGAPVLHRGGGTSLAGQTVGSGAVIIDSSKYCHAILSIDPEKRLAMVEPGCVLDDLRDAANAFGLTFGPDPSTHTHNTLGGMLGNNSCGVHSVMAGRTVDNVDSLDILTYDGLRLTVGATDPAELGRRAALPGREGEIFRALDALQTRYGDEIRATFPHLPRLVSGYRLEFLLPENGFHVARALVGTESTCVTILRATLNLVPDPAKTLVILGFDDLATAADAIPEIIAQGPIACEAMDHEMVESMKRKNFKVRDIKDLPDGRAWLLVQIGGKDNDDAEANARKIRDALKGLPHLTADELVSDPKRRAALWDVRKAGLPVTAWVPGQKRDTWEGWEDSAVPRENLGRYVRQLKALMDKHDYHAAMYGHFGDGLIHMRLDSGLHTPDAVKNYRSFIEEAADLVVRLGGSLSGEHGDGQARSELLPRMYTAKVMEAFAAFKRIWDPANKMNPGDKVEPKKLDDDLRFGPHFQPRPLSTMFTYRESEGDFRRAAIRCVGVGECRRHDTGTMCPSYRATREEKHSTRGRSRMFQEMLQGNPVSGGWNSVEVRDALHLCLACKACKSECPVNVDMATYKAEFLYHHYRGRSRPLVHYAIGMIPVWARLATSFPGAAGIANLVAGFKPFKTALGIHPDRAVPKFAGRTFRSSFTGDSGNGRRVLLWADTFNDHFTPHVLDAAAKVLRQAGWKVSLANRGLCCGRPYYDFGMLDRARSHLKAMVDRLVPEIDGDTWVVGVEPSCVAVFKDELLNMLPDDPAARHLAAHTMMLGEFLCGHSRFRPEATDRKILFHPHCHQHAVLGIDPDQKLLSQAGSGCEVLDCGCCGMAGSFGYETDKYPVSRSIAEQRLLPRVRALAGKEILVANGFSCRTQLADLAGYRALTLAEVLAGR